MRLIQLSLLATSLLALNSIANAGTLGFSNTFGPGGNYAVFDKFTNSGSYPNISITGQAPILEDGTAAGATAFSSSLAASMFGTASGSGARLYNGIQEYSYAFNVSISGTAQQNLTSISLQIRFSEPDGYTFGEFFNSVTLNGVAATGVVTIDDGSIGELSGGGNTSDYGIVQWTWTGLNLEEDDIFNINIGSVAGGHASIDSLRVDAIPEPSTYALLVAAGAAGFLKLRRRRSA